MRPPWSCGGARSPRNPVKVETAGSNPVWTAHAGAARWRSNGLRSRRLGVRIPSPAPSRCSSTDRAPVSGTGGCRFESCHRGHADDARLVEHLHGKQDHTGFDSRLRLVCSRSSMDEQRGPNAMAAGSSPTESASGSGTGQACRASLLASACRKAWVSTTPASALERVRLVEDTGLKPAGCNRLGRSNRPLSAYGGAATGDAAELEPRWPAKAGLSVQLGPPPLMLR